MSKVILYGVLNWGLGHATRSIPYIEKLLKEGFRIIIASDGDALKLLRKEFQSKVEYETLPSYNIRYTKNSIWFHLNLIKQTPHILRTIKAEKEVVAELVEKYHPKKIISDHRYGFFHSDIHSIFLGHQLYLDFPQNKIIEKFANYLHRQKIDVFNEIQVPDFASPKNISGRLSTYKHPNIQFIESLSRMKYLQIEEEFDICVVLSGPEPQRTVLEETLLKSLSKSSLKIIFIRGIFIEETLDVNFKNKASRIYNYCHTEKLNRLMSSSKLIICRSGYSSIMDLINLKKQAILIPTPNLPEQNYLAKRMQKFGWFFSINQDDFSLELLQKDLSEYRFPSFE